MSSPEPEQVAALEREMRLMSSFGALFNQAVSDRVGMHSTDIETIDLLNVLGPMTAGELAGRIGLSSGATTRLIDRLERAGRVHRNRDAADRRRVIIEPAYENLDTVGSLYLPLAEDLRALWSKYSAEQIATIIDFCRRSNEIVAHRNATLRAQADT